MNYTENIFEGTKCAPTLGELEKQNLAKRKKIAEYNSQARRNGWDLVARIPESVLDLIETISDLKRYGF